MLKAKTHHHDCVGVIELGHEARFHRDLVGVLVALGNRDYVHAFPPDLAGHVREVWERRHHAKCRASRERDRKQENGQSCASAS